MPTAYITHSDFYKHLTPTGHPEQVDRLRVIEDALAKPNFDTLLRISAPVGTMDQVELCHPQDYVLQIKNACPSHGYVNLDGDTHVSVGSFDAAMRAVGGVCSAIDLVMGGEAYNAFCATRPPGHHAETNKSMGFCLFGTVSIGAKYAIRKYGLSRIAIIDFDVHHGNGTQDLVWNDPNIMFVTSQQIPLWPGTGEVSEIGAHNNVINLPLKPYSSGAELMAAYQHSIFPKLAVYKPEILLISAGFDAHINDPLANLNFSTEDFKDITKMLCEFADNHCHGRVVSTLEGGYDLPSLADSVAAHVNVLMEHAK
ncbi:MAG: histone deacetylase family protein [Amylibacter sp.]|nr:histone deacetylase family protein [Amylibacter sp.]